MAIAPCTRHFLSFSIPASSFGANPACQRSPVLYPTSAYTSSFLVPLSQNFLVRNLRPRAAQTPRLLDKILAYLNCDDKLEEKKVGKRVGKSNESFVLQIQHEMRTRRKTDRDSTPVVRAMTWALRGAKDVGAVGAIVGDLEFSINIFTSVIQKLGMEGKPQAALALFRWLQQREEDSALPGQPNVYTYNSLLGALKANQCYKLAATILEDMTENGVASDIVTCNTVISMYEQQGRYEDAFKVFEDLEASGMVPDLFTYRNVIQILARIGKYEHMLEIYMDLKQQERRGLANVRPELKREKGQREELDVFVVKVCCRRLWGWLGSDTSTVPEVGELIGRMQGAEVNLNAKMCKDLIRACGQREVDHYLVKWLYFSMREQGSPVTVSLCNHVIKALGKGKKWWAALEIYENMMSLGPTPNETTQRLLLSHFQILLNSARERRIWKWALQLLEKMQEKGIKPDAFAWNAALIACGRAHEPASAIQVFQNMTLHGHKPGVLSYTALLSALEKGNLFEKAEEVWIHMHKLGMMPNEYTYTTMIAVRGKAGNYGKAVALLDEMQTFGLEPTVVTYNAVITACAQAGDGQRAQDWLQLMTTAGVKPDSVTYSQVIEALANEGQWELAISYYKKMLELELHPPCSAYDAVLRVCNANNAPVDLTILGPRPLDSRVRHQAKRKQLKGWCENTDTTITMAV